MEMRGRLHCQKLEQVVHCDVWLADEQIESRKQLFASLVIM